jgi:hypothetical protein
MHSRYNVKLYTVFVGRPKAVLPKPEYITQNWIKVVFVWVTTHLGIHIKMYRKSVEEEVL